MRNDVESEVKTVTPKPSSQRPEPRRDPSLTGGEKVETPKERKQREEEKHKPKQAPIIQRDVT